MYPTGLTEAEEFGLHYGKYIGGGTLFIVLIAIFALYFSSVTKFISRRGMLKTQIILDLVFGIGFPIGGLWLMMLLEDFFTDLYNVTGLINDPHGYAVLGVTSIALGIFAILKKRKTLGVSLILITIVSAIVAYVFITGIQAAH